MFKHFVNFVRVTRDNFPNVLQGLVTMQWLRAITKPLRVMYSEYLVLRADYLFKVKFNGQAGNLTTILNIRFDPDLKRILVIDSVERSNYIYPVADLKKKRIYSRWEETRDYEVGQFATEDRYLFRAIAPSTGVAPKTSTITNAGKWEYHTERRMILHYLKDTDGVSRYIVYVPFGLIYDANYFTAVLNYYRYWGLAYQIIQY